jgi:23S rRNA (uracil1939-C5)-methyltransferase
MGRRNRKLPFLENLVIEDAGSEGKAVARFNDRVVFIPFAVPGDVVDVQVIKKRKNYYEGKIVEFKEHSSLRVQPECQHFGVCGGCKWQVLNYKDQLSFKQKQVEDALSRIGKIDTTGLSPILANDKPYFYRNKLEFTFSNFKWLEDFQKGEDISQRNMNGLGFHKPGMFDRIVDIKKCHLMEEPANAIRLSVKEFADKNDFSFYDIKRQEGLLRNLIIRSSSKGDLMVILVFHKQIMEKMKLSWST